MLAAKSAAGNVLNPSSRAEMISVGGAIFPNGNSRKSGLLSILIPEKRSEQGLNGLDNVHHAILFYLGRSGDQFGPNTNKSD